MINFALLQLKFDNKKQIKRPKTNYLVYNIKYIMYCLQYKVHYILSTI